MTYGEYLYEKLMRLSLDCEGTGGMKRWQGDDATTLALGRVLSNKKTVAGAGTATQSLYAEKSKS